MNSVICLQILFLLFQLIALRYTRETEKKLKKKEQEFGELLAQNFALIQALKTANKVLARNSIFPEDLKEFSQAIRGLEK